MSYTIYPSKRFRKAVKKLNRGNLHGILHNANQVIQLLGKYDRQSRKILGSEWYDHALKGKLSNLREIHLGFDHLLLYAVDEEGQAIELIDIVSHDDLQKWHR